MLFIDRYMPFKDKERHREFCRMYNQEHRDAISERKEELRKIRYDCPCGSNISKCRMSEHRKSMKHQRFLEAETKKSGNEVV